MGTHHHIREVWKDPRKILGEIYKNRLVQWRKENAVTRIEFPTNLIRARALGYKAKQGLVLVRVRVGRGGKQRPQIKKGRRSKHKYQKLNLGKSYQWLSEERAQKKCERYESGCFFFHDSYSDD